MFLKKIVSGIKADNTKVVFFTLSLFVLPLLPVLFGEPLWDDNYFVFSEKTTGAPSFFSFWDRTSGYYRSWPLTYSFLWTIFCIFKKNFLVYKLINLVLHFITSLCLYKVSKNFISPLKAFFASLIFLIHPTQIEAIAWIFQLKTILSTLLFVISFQLLIKYLENKKKKILIV